MFLIYFMPTLIIALGLSFFAVIFVRACGTRTRGDMRRVVVWSILFGLLGFLVGFFGPLYIGPESPQGPLLGIVISGPAGAVLGCIAGVVRSLYLFRHSKPPKI
jgi:hypothetical protein